MITFEPLHKTLKAKGLTQYKLIEEGVLRPSEVTRMQNGHNFTLKFVEKLCSYLNCQPNEVIAHIAD